MLVFTSHITQTLWIAIPYLNSMGQCSPACLRFASLWGNASARQRPSGPSAGPRMQHGRLQNYRQWLATIITITITITIIITITITITIIGCLSFWLFKLVINPIKSLLNLASNPLLFAGAPGQLPGAGSITLDSAASSACGAVLGSYDYTVRYCSDQAPKRAENPKSWMIWMFEMWNIHYYYTFMFYLTAW